MQKKTQLGQFYTTRAEYIIGDLLGVLPDDAQIVEPFCGQGDLVLTSHSYTLYDCDPKIPQCQQRDTLISPPDYQDKWVITNPPFLARNKSTDKKIFDLYHTSDLYKAAVLSMLGCAGGVLILPLNFFCDDDDFLRNKFFSVFMIIRLKVFEEQIFDDTPYTCCAFSFVRGKSSEIPCTFLPSGEVHTFFIDGSSSWRIGGEFWKGFAPYTTHKIGRLKEGEATNSSLFLRAVDSGSLHGRISLTIREVPHWGQKNERTFATIKLDKKYSLLDQQRICLEFNRILEQGRSEYHSMFLTSFRNSSRHGARKRIGFDAAYTLIHYIIKTILWPNSSF